MYELKLLLSHVRVFQLVVHYNYPIFLDIIHRPDFFFYFERKFSETGFCISVGLNLLGFYLKTKTESSPRNVMF
jgi:hypothetical protein